jgi:hypothetical protein
LPSITGRGRGRRPDVAEAEHASAVGHDGDAVGPVGVSYAVSELRAIAMLGAATPGVYQTAKSSSTRIGHLGKTWTLPR